MPGFNFYGNPVDAAPPAPAAVPAPAPKPAGPTGFWQRIGMVGIGKVNALNAYRTTVEHQPAVESNNSPIKTAARDTTHAGAATGRFLFGNTAKFANQGFQEGKQAVDTTRQLIDTHNATNKEKGYQVALMTGDKNKIAAAKAQLGNADTSVTQDTSREKNDYKGFQKGKGGLLNEGTLTTSKEAQSGDLKTGLKKIGGGTLATAAEIAPLGKVTEGSKVYRAGEGVVDASKAAKGASVTEKLVKGGTKVAEQTAVGVGAGTAGSAGAQLASNGKINWGQVAKSGVGGGIIGGGSTALGKLVGVFKDGPGAALDTLKKGAPSSLPKKGMTDVMSADNADKVAQSGKISVKGGDTTGTSIAVHQPVKMSDGEYTQRFNALSKSYDKGMKNAEKASTPQKQMMMSNAIDNQHKAALEQLNHDYQHGYFPDKSTGLGKVTAKLQANPHAPSEAGAATTATEKLTGAKTPAMAAEATPKDTATLEQSVSRPKAATEPTTPQELPNNNKAAQKGIGAFVQSKGAGTFNPELAAARQGNTEFSGALRNISSGDVAANFHGHATADKFESLYNDYLKGGGSHEQFIKDIESGKMGSQAHEFWVQHFQTLGKQLSDTGVLKNGARDASYVPRMAQFGDKGGSGSMGGLRKTGGFSKGRLQESTDALGHPTNDMFKTHADFKAAVEKGGGKVASNPVDIMRSATAARLKAINHTEGLNTLDKTAMRDGRAATITFSQKDGLPPGYRDYNTAVLPGRAVHPEAVKGIEALTKVSSLADHPFERGLAKLNSISKRLVTMNGIVHGKNFALASIREQGLRGTALAMHDTKLASEEDWNRAISHGFVPSRSGMTNIFDQALEGKGKLADATSVLGKIRNKSDKALFEGFGDKLGMSTYMHTEKALIAKGLSKDEAGKIAADTANRVIFSQRSTETSAAMRETSRLALFAGKFFQSTLQVGSKATGLGKNNALSEAAQKVEQRQAAKNLARGFAYLFTAAQALNYATTGHSTFQNKDSKISPVFYVDKSTGKEYHITNFYGQIGELMNLASPKTLINKASPGLQEISRIMSNTDQYKGTNIRDTSASGPRQLAQVFANILENAATPLGFQVSTLNQSFGAGHQPGQVAGAKLLGYGVSTKDQTPIEKQIDQQYYKTLPQGQGAASDQQLAQSEARARQDIKNGNTTSDNVKAVQSKLSPTAFKKFMNTGADSSTQRHFESLPTEQKLQLIQKYSPEQLKELDFSSLAKSLTGSSAKTTVESLQQKGFTPDQISQIMQKVGYGQSQLDQIKQEARVQARQNSAKTRYQPKWQNPLLK